MEHVGMRDRAVRCAAMAVQRSRSLVHIAGSPCGRWLSAMFIASMLLATGSSSAARDERHTASPPTEACAAGNGGITLPAGFCATVFADNVGHARHLVVAPNGVVYVADDAQGRIWRIVYRGGTAAMPAAPAPAPAKGTGASAPAQQVGPPEGIHPDAGSEAARTLPTPTGATPAVVALGDRVYHGQVGGAACAGCHGSDAEGTPLGPDLTDGKWRWGDGSLPAITRTITNGVPEPKDYTGVMPPMGGTPLSSAEVSAVAAYVWALGHQSAR